MASVTSVSVTSVYEPEPGEPIFPVVDLGSVALSDRRATESREQEINELISNLNKKLLDANKELEVVRKKLIDTEAQLVMTRDEAARERREATKERREVKTIEYSVREWSRVGKQKPIFTRDEAAIQAWSRYWYMRIEKTDTGGVYCALCCQGEESPILRDYQFFVKDRHIEGTAIVGRRHTATFGNLSYSSERTKVAPAWGYNLVAKMAELSSKNAYDLKEDIVTFGVQIEIPYENARKADSKTNWIDISSSDVIRRVSSALKEVLNQSSANLPQVLCSLVGEYVRGDIVIE